jgi:hypothetical protein
MSGGTFQSSLIFFLTKKAEFCMVYSYNMVILSYVLA